MKERKCNVDLKYIKRLKNRKNIVKKNPYFVSFLQEKDFLVKLYM